MDDAALRRGYRSLVRRLAEIDAEGEALVADLFTVPAHAPLDEGATRRRLDELAAQQEDLRSRQGVILEEARKRGLDWAREV